MSEFPAIPFAQAWQAVAVASGPNEATPSLDRTILIERFPGKGVRLAATDTYILACCWVAEDGVDDLDILAPPDMDAAPDETVIACDPDGRGPVLLSYMAKLAKDQPINVRLRVAEAARPDMPSFDGMEKRSVILEHPDAERIVLTVHEGPAVNWRKLLADQTAKATKTQTWMPDMLGRLAKIGKIVGAAVHLDFAGSDKPAQFRCAGLRVEVSGLAMPSRP